MRTDNVAAFAIGALLVAVLGAGTAVAATGQNVNIRDATTGTAAKVVTGGRLLVKASDGSGPMTVDGTVGVTGPVQVNDGDGPLTVDGTVALSGRVDEALPDQVVGTVYMNPINANGATDCQALPLSLPTGVPVHLDRFVATFGLVTPADNPRLSLRFWTLKDGYTLVFDMPVDLTKPTGDGQAGGSLDVNLTVKRNAVENAQIGDIYDVAACANRGGAGSGTQLTGVLIGHQ